MNSIAVSSPKGGVGKTTLALNLAYSLSRRGWKTLLVDTDPVGGVGLSLPAMTGSKGLMGWLHGAPFEECAKATRLETFGILPVGSVSVLETAAFAEQISDGTRLRALLREAEKHGYQVVLFDTPAGLSGTTIGVLRAAEHVIVPVQAEPLAARAVSGMLEAIASLRTTGPLAKLSGIVLMMLQQRVGDSLNVAMDLWSELPGNLVFEATVPRDVVFLSASTAGVPVGLLRKNPPPIVGVFDRIAEELEKAVNLRRTEEEDDAPLSLFA